MKLCKKMMCRRKTEIKMVRKEVTQEEGRSWAGNEEEEEEELWRDRAGC
jgi:hypothetical protein